MNSLGVRTAVQVESESAEGLERMENFNGPGGPGGPGGPEICPWPSERWVLGKAYRLVVPI